MQFSNQNKFNGGGKKRPFILNEPNFAANAPNFIPRSQLINNKRSKPNNNNSDQADLNNSSASSSGLSSSSLGISGNQRHSIAQLETRKLQLKKERENLPVYSAQDKIVEEIRTHPTCIIIGETGSGKTTQIPQFLVTCGVSQGGVIAVTQPRRVAAVTLASRVAQEMGYNLGTQVGYSVRFESMASDSTKILYQTDGMLLREAMIDPQLKRYSVIMLDEAHERSLRTDVLFGIVKKAQKYRINSLDIKPLKILIMSATMDVDHFSKYFHDCRVLYVEGRQHKVQVFYCANKSQDYCHNAIVSVFQLHREKPIDQQMLVFLTGQDEIETTVRKIREVAREMPADSPRINVIGFFSACAASQQIKVFEPPKPGTRKVILATNIAETSLTIPGIGIVIDSGKVKSRVYNPNGRLDMLRVVGVSKAQANQRAGRAGREGAGFSYRLYTEPQFDSFAANAEPEIKRCNLAGVVLELLSMGIRDVFGFDFMDKPSIDALTAACRELLYLGAIDFEDANERNRLNNGLKLSENPRMKLTELGNKLTPFPLDPKLARVLVSASELGCLEEALSIVAMMCQENILINHAANKQKCDEAHNKFSAPEGDHFKMLALFNGYKKAAKLNENRLWCVDHFVHERQLMGVQMIRDQLRDICRDKKMEITQAHTNKDLIRKALCAGLFLNAAELQEGYNYKILDGNVNAKIHPSSCLMHSKPSLVIFSDLIFTNQPYCRDVTVVEKEWLLEAAPDYFREKHFS